MSDHDRERETTIVHTDSGRGGGTTAIAVVLLLIVLLLLLWYMGVLDGVLGGGGDTTDVKVDVSAPGTGTGS